MSATPGRSARGLAFGWGLAEATFFFLVPDILSSRLVLRDPKAGFTACLWSLAGALLGGCVLFILGRNPATAEVLLHAFDHVPGIQPSVMAEARCGLEQSGATALFAGFIGGIPYKLYAVQAAGAGLGLPVFLAASAVSRLGRFLLTTGFAWAIGRLLLHKLAPAAILRVHAAGWCIFYAVYFWRMGL